jgi:hypothetical protein
MSVLDQMNQTELLALSALFLAEAEELPNGDPWKAKLLQVVWQLLDRVRGLDSGAADIRAQPLIERRVFERLRKVF